MKKKRRKPITRDYNDCQYRMWRLLVLDRDNHKCRWPGCTRRNRLQVHHIKRYANYPLLRFSLQNGISLCFSHHKKVTGKEEQYEVMFNNILLGDVIVDILIEENQAKNE